MYWHNRIVLCAISHIALDHKIVWQSSNVLKYSIVLKYGQGIIDFRWDNISWSGTCMKNFISDINLFAQSQSITAPPFALPLCRLFTFFYLFSMNLFFHNNRNYRRMCCSSLNCCWCCHCCCLSMMDLMVHLFIFFQYVFMFKMV